MTMILYILEMLVHYYISTNYLHNNNLFASEILKIIIIVSLAIARPTYFPQHRIYCITGTREGKVWCNALHSNLNSAEFWRTESDWLTDYCYVTDTANNFPRSQPEATPLELYSAHIPRRYPWRYRGPTLRSRALFG